MTDPMVTIVCDDRRSPFHRAKGRHVVGVMLSEQRWDGRGRYWVMPVEMSARERQIYQSAELGDRSALPRKRPGSEPRGFYFVRNGEPVTDRAQAIAITNAMHHGSGPGRIGIPEPGVLDGVHRKLFLPGCRCGAAGVTASGPAASRALDGFLASGMTTVTLELFRVAATRPE